MLWIKRLLFGVLIALVISVALPVGWLGLRLTRHMWRPPIERIYTGESTRQRRPIVLVHGLNRSGGMWIEADDEVPPRWTSMAARLRASGYPNLYINTFADTRNTSLLANARVLKKWIDDAKHRFGAARVDIIAHSLGGLIARAYAQELDRENGLPAKPVPYGHDVAHLIMIATPHLGSPLADPFTRVVNWYAARELRDGGGPDLQRLNALPLPCDVAFHSVVVTAVRVDTRHRRWWSPFRLIRWFLADHQPTDGDGTIGLASQNLARAVPPSSCPGPILTAHQVQADMGFHHRNEPDSRTVQDTVLDILNEAKQETATK